MDEVRLFLVRVWSRLHGGSSFRASVRPLDGDRPLVFTQPEQVAAFLKEEAEGAETPQASKPPSAGNGAGHGNDEQ